MLGRAIVVGVTALMLPFASFAHAAVGRFGTTKIARGFELCRKCLSGLLIAVPSGRERKYGLRHISLELLNGVDQKFHRSLSDRRKGRPKGDINYSERNSLVEDLCGISAETGEINTV
jgi:hypothetical protein